MDLKYAHEHNYQWGEDTCYYAAVNGQLECLKYAHERGCEWDEETICFATARNGRLETQKYLHQQECPWNEGHAGKLLEMGTWSALNMLRDSWTVREAANLECLKYANEANENDCPEWLDDYDA